MGIKPEANLDNSHTIEIAVSGSYVRVKNDADPMLLQQIITILRSGQWSAISAEPSTCTLITGYTDMRKIYWWALRYRAWPAETRTWPDISLSVLRKALRQDQDPSSWERRFCTDLQTAVSRAWLLSVFPEQVEVRDLTWQEFDWLMSGIDLEQPKAIRIWPQMNTGKSAGNIDFKPFPGLPK